MFEAVFVDTGRFVAPRLLESALWSCLVQETRAPEEGTLFALLWRQTAADKTVLNHL
jgi:hypothetical protein